jgi:DNA repair exonuclease SbcCD ATPase subunit
MGKLIDRAKAFLKSKSAKAQAFYDREHALRTKLTELEAQKSKIYAEYDPSKPFDPKKIDAIDAQIDEINKELAVLAVSKQSVSDYDPDDLIKHIADVKTEATDVISAKQKAEAAARQAILDAKKALLDAQAEHFRILRDAKDYVADINDILRELKRPVDEEIAKLRRQLQQVDREIYEQAGGGGTPLNAVRDNQPVIDRLYEQKGEIGRKISMLETYAAEIGDGMPTLDSYRDNNGKTIYFVHADEQQQAAKNGVS